MNQQLLKLRYAGLAVVVGGWLVILAAISRNPWFVFTENAFSDLGNPLANDPWLFNYGMIINGLLIILYSLYLIEVSFNKTGTVGGAFMTITGVFLVLIGVFHEGSPNHFFVSLWFFTQGDLTTLTWGLALYRDTKWHRYGLGFMALSIVGTAVAFVVPWPSTAVIEAYGILIMNVWVVLMTRITPGFTET
jgi:hypothetical membrane protein